MFNDAVSNLLCYVASKDRIIVNYEVKIMQKEAVVACFRHCITINWREWGKQFKYSPGVVFQNKALMKIFEPKRDSVEKR
jgi:catabolite regulation protein CreA